MKSTWFTSNPVILLLVILLVWSCKDDNETNPSNEASNGKIFFDSSDPRLAELKASSGDIITFIGKRNDAGKPVMLTGYTIGSGNNSNQTDLVTLDSKGRLSTLMNKNGWQVNFLYTESDSIVASVLRPDGKLEIFNLKAIDKGDPNYAKRLAQTTTNAPLASNQKYLSIKVNSKDQDNKIEHVIDSNVLVEIDGGPMTEKIIGLAWHDTNKPGFYKFPLPIPNVPNSTLTAAETIEVLRAGLQSVCKAGVPMAFLCQVLPDACSSITPLGAACEAVDELEDLEKANTATNNYSKLNFENSIVITRSFHPTLGVATATKNGETILKDRVNSNTEFDIELVHPYDNTVGDWDVVYIWTNGEQAGESGGFTAKFLKDHRLLTSAGYGGVWASYDKAISGSVDNTVTYYGIKQARDYLIGTMIDREDDSVGNWSAKKR